MILTTQGSQSQEPAHKVTALQHQIDIIQGIYCSDERLINYKDGYLYNPHNAKERIYSKNYHLWTASDLVIIRKEDQMTFNFLNAAIDHNRLDVLESVLPDYYRDHGGVQAFAAALKNPEAAVIAEAGARSGSQPGSVPETYIGPFGNSQKTQFAIQNYLKNQGVTGQDFKGWTEQEFEKMARNTQGAPYFKEVADLVIIVRNTPPTSNPVNQSMQAYQLLGILGAGDTQQERERFYSVIETVDRRVNPERAKLHQYHGGGQAQSSSNTAAPHSLLQQTPDHQELLAMLDAHGVTMDPTHELKSPPRAQALEAVAAISGNVRAA